MCNLLQDCQTHKKFNAVVKKYQKDKYSKVAKIKITQKWIIPSITNLQQKPH